METLEPLSGDRKCFRLINGVLVERTVNDVVPALKTNQEGLKKVLDDMVKQYKSKQDELDKWKVCSALISALRLLILILTNLAEKAQRSGRSSIIVWAKYRTITALQTTVSRSSTAYEAFYRRDYVFSTTNMLVAQSV